MSNKIIIGLIVSIGAIVIATLMICFVNWSFDFSSWGAVERIVYLSVMISLGTFSYLTYIDHSGKD